MAERNSSLENISTIGEINCDHIHPIFREPFKITKELFSSSTEFNLEKFVSYVNHYIQANFSDTETISNILGIFSIVRPKQQELLTKIENAISITHSSMENFFSFIPTDLPLIFELDITQSPILEFIKNDDFENLLQFVSNKVDFDLSQTFEIGYRKFVNLLDIAAYYGSIQCFKYLACNNVPFSEYVCPLSICGGNYEIIHYLENHYKEQNFDQPICMDACIIYHRYEIADWLVLNYGQTMGKASIFSFNFSVPPNSNILKPTSSYSNFDYMRSGNLPFFRYIFEVEKIDPNTVDGVRRTPLHLACNFNKLSIVRYLCEVAKVNTEAKNLRGETPLHEACYNGHLPVVQYLCEVQKVNTEAKDTYGRTALHIACFCNELPVVQYLCEVAKVNTEGAYDIAKPEIKEYLKKYLSK